jgi:hypothetical protein
VVVSKEVQGGVLPKRARWVRTHKTHNDKIVPYDMENRLTLHWALQVRRQHRRGRRARYDAMNGVWRRTPRDGIDWKAAIGPLSSGVRRAAHDPQPLWGCGQVLGPQGSLIFFLSHVT